MKKAKTKYGKLTLCLSAYAISMGAFILCANSKYNNTKATFEKYGLLENGKLPTEFVECLGTSVIKKEDITDIEKLRDEGYMFDENGDAYKDVFTKRNIDEQAETKFKNTVNRGMYVSGGIAVALAARMELSDEHKKRTVK